MYGWLLRNQKWEWLILYIYKQYKSIYIYIEAPNKKGVGALNVPQLFSFFLACGPIKRA